MKVYFAIASYAGLRDSSGKPNCPAFSKSLYETINLFREQGHEVIVGIRERCCYVQAARNELVKSFREGDCDVLFFLDDDISWDAKEALKLAEMPDGIVAGIYPMKRDKEDYPAVILSDAKGFPVVRPDGCIAASQVPTGFLRIKRQVIEKMCEWYADRKYSVVTDGEITDGYVDLFPQGLHGDRWVGEDYAFCRLWNAIPGAQIWIVPDIDFSHYAGDREFKGNYHQFLCRRPGGSSADPTPIDKALRIPGFMTAEELLWLAEQAKSRKTIVEIGSYRGRSTRALADATKGIVWAIDDWQGPRDVQLTDADRAGLLSEFRTNNADHIESGKIKICLSDHASALIPGIMDMVFIDGSHEYEDVKADILRWKSRLASGGILCGHDATWPGVKQALSELIPSHSIAPQTDIWYMTA